MDKVLARAQEGVPSWSSAECDEHGPEYAKTIDTQVADEAARRSRIDNKINWTLRTSLAFIPIVLGMVAFLHNDAFGEFTAGSIVGLYVAAAFVAAQLTGATLSCLRALRVEGYQYPPTVLPREGETANQTKVRYAIERHLANANNQELTNKRLSHLKVAHVHLRNGFTVLGVTVVAVVGIVVYRLYFMPAADSPLPGNPNGS